jgi:hypothetical protein
MKKRISERVSSVKSDYQKESSNDVRNIADNRG